MIRGNKPAGYGVTYDAKGRRIEVEFRQCSHCQFTWEFKPGSGRKYGMCTYCMGLLCSKCLKITWRKADNRCLPYYDTVLENNDKYFLDTNIGIFLRK